jgi:hypothetical protein
MANGQGALPKFCFESWRTLLMSHSTASGRHDNLADLKAKANHVSYQAGIMKSFSSSRIERNLCEHCNFQTPQTQRERIAL